MLQEEIQTVKDREEYINLYHKKGGYNNIGNYKLLLNWNSYNNGEPILTIGPNCKPATIQISYSCSPSSSSTSPVS
jgi:hypothetical protein